MKRKEAEVLVRMARAFAFLQYDGLVKQDLPDGWKEKYHAWSIEFFKQYEDEEFDWLDCVFFLMVKMWDEEGWLDNEKVSELRKENDLAHDVSR